MLDKISSGDSIIAALAFLNYSNILKENGINHKLDKYPQTLKNIKIDKTLQENFVNVEEVELLLSKPKTFLTL